MDWTSLLVLLPMATFLAVIAFAVYSKKRTQAEIKADDHQKSSLAKDGPGPQPFR